MGFKNTILAKFSIFSINGGFFRWHARFEFPLQCIKFCYDAIYRLQCYSTSETQEEQRTAVEMVLQVTEHTLRPIVHAKPVFFDCFWHQNIPHMILQERLK